MTDQMLLIILALFGVSLFICAIVMILDSNRKEKLMSESVIFRVSGLTPDQKEFVENNTHKLRLDSVCSFMSCPDNNLAECTGCILLPELNPDMTVELIKDDE